MVTILFFVLLSAPVYGQLLDEGPVEPMLDVPQQEPLQIALADESDEPDSGNWYEKLKWWKEAKWTYTVDVFAAMEKLTSLEKAYGLRKSDMLGKINEYSSSLPVKRQIAEKEIDDLIEDMVRRQNELAKEEPNKRDESQSDELEQQKKMLSDLKERFSQFNKLAHSIKQVFDEVVPQQLADAKLYDEKALKSYQAIENILDDKRAEQLFNEVENGLENIKAITNYLKGPLDGFLDRAWQKSQSIMPQIVDDIQRLEAEGIVVRPLSEEEKAQMSAIENQRYELKAKKVQEAQAAKEKAARSWYEKLFLSISSFFSQIRSWLVTPFSWVGSLFNRSVPTKDKVAVPELKPAKK